MPRAKRDDRAQEPGRPSAPSDPHIQGGDQGSRPGKPGRPLVAAAPSHKLGRPLAAAAPSHKLGRPLAAADATYSVSQVTQSIAHALKNAFPEAFWVTGEIQSYNRDADAAARRRWGQVYFELIEKEEGADAAKAAVKAVAWGDTHAAIRRKLAQASEKLALRDGVKVRFLCEVDFYWPRASLQLKVLDVDPNFTLGDMERARQELLKALQEKGLVDRNKSLPFPDVPTALGLITSDGSAAYHDFLQELKGAGYSFAVRFWDARMQGAETEESVLRGLARLEADPAVDVIALVRGGGSRSDLIWFDKEKIAYAIAQCRKPVVTGIGHEIDLSVADVVAHRHFKTPTAVAQFLAGRAADFEARVLEAGRRITDIVTARLLAETRNLSDSANTWRYAATLFVQRLRGELAGAAQSLAGAALRRFSVEKERLAAQLKELSLKDPKRLLERGYCLLTSAGRAVKSVADLNVGDEFDAVLRDGVLSARALAKRKA